MALVVQVRAVMVTSVCAFIYYGADAIGRQLFSRIVPVSGQKQLSIGSTWQSAVTLWPLLLSPVQFVQLKATPALAGAISNTELRSVAAILANKSIFFFISKSFLVAPSEMGARFQQIETRNAPQAGPEDRRCIDAPFPKSESSKTRRVK